MVKAELLAVIVDLLFLSSFDWIRNLIRISLAGISRPADSGGGDAQDRAHVPAEHGAAAGREAGWPGGEQRARL